MRHDTAHTRRVPVFESMLVVLALLLAAARAQAAFQYPQLGARAAAMSGASIPAQPDSASIFQNPAGVSGLDRGEAYMMYDKLYAGQKGVDSIGQGFLAAGAPTRWGALSAGVSDFKAAGLLDERMVGVGFSRPLAGGIDAGVTLKYLYHKYAPGSDQSGVGDPIFARGTARGAAAFDAGVIATLSKTVKAAFAVRNINSPDVGLDSEDRVPREYQAGLAYDAPGWLLKTTADVVYRDNHVGTLRDRATPSIGFEKSFADAPVKFRVGASPDQFSAGVGFQFNRFGFDYAFILTRNMISSSAGSHVIAVRYRFGGASAAAKGNN
jgi:hypothetical protein